MLFKDTDFMKNHLRWKAVKIANNEISMLINCFILVIGADSFLCMTPKVIHGIELWAAYRKPNELYVKACSYIARMLRCVAGIFIK
jgi:hypothetical protein